jgi:uncharacterized protein YwqG
MALPKTVREFELSLSKISLPPGVIERLVEQSRPALAWDLTLDASVRLGASKMGGLPDLPVQQGWPIRPPYPDADRRIRDYNWRIERTREDASDPKSWIKPEDAEDFCADYQRHIEAVQQTFPLSFLLQIDLSEVAGMVGFDPLLPDYGRLLFFYDYYETPEGFNPASHVGWSLLWDQTPIEQLRRASPPPEFVALSSAVPALIFKSAAMSWRPVITPIPWSDRAWDAFSLDDDGLYRHYDKWLGTLDHSGDSNDQHWLGGWPRPLQNSMQADAQLASNGVYCGDSDIYKTETAKALLESAQDWRLIMQIGPASEIDMGDVGCLYVLMREPDIVTRRFDRAWVVYQQD